MILDTRRKLIYIHIPKTGGYSTRKYYKLRYPTKKYKQDGHRFFVNNQHATSEEVKKFYPKEWRTYHKFCTVRDPWDRFVSFYYHFLYRKNRVIDSFDFEYFLINYFNDPKKIFLPYLFNSSVNFLKPCTTWTDAGIDTVLKLENLEADIHKFDRLMGFKKNKIIHANKSKRDKNKIPGRDHYNSKTKDIIYKHFKSDIKRFNYEF